MTLPYDKFAATILLPDAAALGALDANLSHWLQRGTFAAQTARQTVLSAVLQQLGRTEESTGLAALQMWGQTSDRPTVWLAAADPVYLEPRLDHLLLHDLRQHALTASEVGALFDYLQTRLAGHARYGFASIGGRGYVRADQPMPTASQPARLLDQQLPTEFLPLDESGSYHALRGEVELALHDHPINLERQQRGLPPVNSLWLWGGGFAPAQETAPQPPLFGGDAMLRGYWYSKTGVVMDWPGSIDACLDAAVAGFVASPDLSAGADPQLWFAALQTALKRSRISKLVLLIDGHGVLTVRPEDRWKVWRRNPDWWMTVK